MKDQNGKPVIKSIKEAAAKDIKAELKEEDQLLGFFDLATDKDQRISANSTSPILSQIGAVTHGKKVKVQIQRNNQEVTTNEIVVQQAIDERKPLFTLFFQRNINNAWSWIGWHPTGPFDSSDVQIEELVGWHYDSGKPNDPPRFAVMNDYKKDKFGTGLLKRIDSAWRGSASLAAEMASARPNCRRSIFTNKNQAKPHGPR